MYREIKDGSVIKLTKYPIVTGNPVNSVSYDSEERASQVVYNVISKTGTETIDITYSTKGSPIIKGITYVGAMVDIFKAEMLGNPASDPAFQLKEQARVDEQLAQLNALHCELKKLNHYMAFITDTIL